MSAVDSKHELFSRRDKAYEPLPIRWNCEWNAGRTTSRFWQDAHESNNVGTRRRGPKRVVGLKTGDLTTFADDNFGFKWQSAEQFSAELYSRSGLSHNQSTGSANVHDSIVLQFCSEDAWPESSMAADIDTSKEDYESHAVNVTTAYRVE